MSAESGRSSRSRRASRSSTLPPPEVGSDADQGAPAATAIPPSDVGGDEVEEEGDEGSEGEEIQRTQRELEQEFERGVGRGSVPPPLISPPPVDRDEHEDLVDMSPLDHRRGGARLEGAIGVEAEDLEPIAKELSRMGTQLRIRVTRLHPDNVPPGEKGPHDWINVPGASPSADQIREMVRERHGGGRYQVEIADQDLSQFGKSIRTIVDVGGDMQPFTIEGRRWFESRYGVSSTRPSLDGKAPLTLPPGGASDPLGFLALFLQQQENRERRDLVDRTKKEENETSIVMKMFEAMSRQPSGGSGFAQTMIAVAPLLMELVRGWRSDAKEERERQASYHREMLEQIRSNSKPQGPAELMSMVQPIFALQQKRAEMELETYAKSQQKVFDLMLEQMKANGREEDASILGSIAAMIRDRGGDILQGTLPMLMGMMQGQTAQQVARSMQVDPAALARGGPTRPMLPAAPMAPAAPRAPRPPAPPAQASAAPTPSPPSTPTPSPSSTTTPPPPDVEPVPPEQPLHVVNPRVVAQAMSVNAMGQFLFHILGFLETRPEPEAVWGLVVNGQAFDVLFGLSPVIFRKRVEETQIDKPFSVEEWCLGAPEEIVAMARDIDATLNANADAREWFGVFLEVGPWRDEED